MAAALAAGGTPAVFAADASVDDWPTFGIEEPEESAEESFEDISDAPEGEQPDDAAEDEEPPEESTAETGVTAPNQSANQPSVSQTEQKPVTKVSENPVRTDLKPYVIQTEKVVEQKAKQSTKTGSQSAKTSKSTSKTEDGDKAGSITSHSVSTTSAKPKLTLTKQQAVNGGEKTSESVKAKPGDTITYYLTLTNDESAQAAAQDVAIADDIPEGMVYVEGSATGDATVSNGTVRWSIGKVNVGQSVLVSYKASIPEDAEAATYSGTANASCYIENEEDSPKTADENRPGLWMGGAVTSLVTVVGSVLKLLRKRDDVAAQE